MLVEIQRWCLAGTQKVGDVLHLYKGHCRRLEFDCLARHCEINQPIGFDVSVNPNGMH